MEPNELLNNPEQIKALISALQGLLNQTPQIDNNTDIEETHDPKKLSVAPSKPNANIKTKGRQKVSSNNIQSKKIESDSVNKFERMSEFAMHKDDCNIDKKLSVVPPVARMRDFEYIDAVCRICGKHESVPPSLMFDSPSRYKCNSCSTQSG
jgi:hypothetical protein